jgi:hypothetical protein
MAAVFNVFPNCIPERHDFVLFHIHESSFPSTLIFASHR